MSMSETRKTVTDHRGTVHRIEDVEAGLVTEFMSPGKLYRLNVDGSWSPSVPEGHPEHGKKYWVVNQRPGT